MPTRLEVMLEAEKRGRLPAQQQAILNEARKRGKVSPFSGTNVSVPNYRVGDGKEYNINDPQQRAEYERLYGARNEAFEQAREAEKQRIENRGIGERIADTATFIGSMPVRMATHGQYGLGDVVGSALPEAGESIESSERDFAMANREALQGIGDVGMASLGVPALSTMGAPARAVGATARALLNKPRFTKRVAQAPSSAQVAKPTPNIQSLPDRLRDLQAFREMEIEPFGPSLASKGTARMARTIEETPVVGGTVKSPKTNVELATSNAVEQLGRDMGASADEATMGARTQQGLDRFRTARLEDLPEGDVAALGINPNRPVATSGAQGNLRLSAPDRLNTAQMSGRELNLAAQSRVELPGSTRTTVEDLAPAQLSRIIRAPSSVTSFATKQQALYERAWQMMPTLIKKNGAVNPNLISTRNAANTVRGILRMEKGADIQGGIVEGKFGRLTSSLKNLNRNFTFENLRNARTAVGRALSEYGTYETSLSRTELKQLYGSITRDMEAGLVAIAARARGAANAGKISQSAANRADRALKAFKQADRYTKLSIERMDRFMNVLGARNLNEAARRVMRSLRENTQDVGQIRELVRSLRPEEWNSIRGYIFQNMGRGRPGSKEAESIFNFNHWATDWARYMGTAEKPSAARGFLLDGLEPSIARRLDNISRIVNRMKYYETTRNFSGTAYTGATGLALMSPSVMATAAAFFGGSAVMGKLLTSRAYVSWLESFMNAQMRLGNTAQANLRITAQHAKRLSSLAARQSDPQLSRAMQAFALALTQSQNEIRQ